MNVGVCIVGFRNSPDVLRCVEALQRSRHDRIQIVICENGGDAAYSGLKHSLSGCHAHGRPVQIVQDPTNAGFAAGINRCIAATPSADAWWILNPDTVPEPDALSLMVRRLQTEGVDAVGCTIVGPDGAIESQGGIWRRWLARAVSLQRPREGEISYISGASLLVSRRFFECTGPMREDYFLYGEEVEWCLRAGRAGLRLAIEPAAIVMHAQGSSTGSVTNMAQRGRMPVYLDERNKLLITRDYSPALLPLAACTTLILLVMRFGKRRAWKQLIYALEGWAAGLRNQRGKPSWVG